jgi:hypothetical protein
MSGMVNPRPYIAPLREREPQQQTGTQPETKETMSNRLGKLSESGSGPVKIDEQGHITEGGFGMKLRSGLYSVGLARKPEEDLKSNQDTLNNVMQLLYEEARDSMAQQNQKWQSEGKKWQVDPDKFAQGVMDSLYGFSTRLDGDSTHRSGLSNTVTVEDRIQRGTYLSGELAGQIKNKFETIVQKSIELTTDKMVIYDQKKEQARIDEANRRGANLERLGPTNQDSVKRFLGQEVKNEGILSTLVNTGAGIIDGIQSGIDNLTGKETRGTAFERSLLQIREQGTTDHPPGDFRYWDAFEEHWTRAMTAPENSIEGMEFGWVQRKLELFANNMAREGTIVDEKMLGAQLTKLTTNFMMSGRIQDLSNHNYVQDGARSFEELSKAILVWRDQQPLEVREQISQNDCEWLAREMLLGQEGDRLLRERAPNVITSVKDWATDLFSFNKTYGKFSSEELRIKILDTVIENYGKTTLPYLMPHGERQHHYLHKYDDNPNEQLKGWFEFKNPPPWGPKELAGLLGDSIKEVLIDRHKRMEEMMPELREVRESREILQQSLEPFPLLKVQTQRYMDHPEVVKLTPRSPGQFINAMITDPLIYARTFAEMKRQIANGEWKSELPPEPPKPKEGAPQKEVEKYQQDKLQYERLVGEEHGRFMKEAIRVREIERQVLTFSQNRFDVFDEVRNTVEEYRNLDPKSLRNDKEKMEEFNQRVDELHRKVGNVWLYAFNLVNDTKNKTELTDKEARDILGAVMASWCDMDAMLNTLELEVGRPQFNIGQLIETPRIESSNKSLRESDTNLRHALEDTLQALESGDPKKMARTSDELKRQLGVAFSTASPLVVGSDEPQARQLLELIDKGYRITLELDRLPALRDRREFIEGWDGVEKYGRGLDYMNHIDKGLGDAPPPRLREPLEKPGWMTTSLHNSVSPYPGLQQYAMKDGPQPARSVRELFERTVVRSVRKGLEDEVKNDKSIGQNDKTKALGARVTSFETGWDEKIVPGLMTLENFQPVPPPPEFDRGDTEKYRQQVEEYRQTLTRYIEETVPKEESVLVASNELIKLMGETGGKEQQDAIYNANMALMDVFNQIGDHIVVARARLQALG